MTAVDWTKPIVIAATDWQDELPARVVEGPTNAGNYRVSIGKPHKTKLDGPRYGGNNSGWYFTPSGYYLSGDTGYIRVINKVTNEEKTLPPKFVVGQKYFSRDGVEYMFLADARDGGYTGRDPLIFVRQNNGAIVRRTPEGTGGVLGDQSDIILPRKSVSTFPEEQSVFFGQGYGSLHVANSLFPGTGPFPVAEMKRQGNEMVFVKMHYPEDKGE